MSRAVVLFAVMCLAWMTLGCDTESESGARPDVVMDTAAQDVTSGPSDVGPADSTNEDAAPDQIGSDAVDAGPGDVAVDVYVEPLPFAPAGPEAAPDPMQFGPFPVGVMTVDLYDDSRPDAVRGTGRWLRTEVWYPAVQAARDGEPATIVLMEQLDGIDLGDKEEVMRNADIPPIPTAAVRDADIDATNGPYPVMLFSHGANGIRFQSVFFTVHLASHGYIVIAPDHDHNTLWDIIIHGFSGDSMADSVLKRPDDMIFLLDKLVAWNAEPGSRFYGTVDEERVAVSGHSLGGVTAAAVACREPRIDAVVFHSPAIGPGLAVGGCAGAPFPVPSLTMGGTLDNTLAYCGQYCDYRNVLKGDQPKYLYELRNGGHFTFSDMCVLDLLSVAQELELGDEADHILRDGCGEDNVPYETAHQTIDYYATAFLNGYIRGSAASLDLLVDRDDPPFDDVSFYSGDVPDFWGEGGCDECSMF